MAEAEREKLKILLKRWIEHNGEHGEEFKRWAEKARSFGDFEVHDHMLEAVHQMGKANESLLSALGRLE